MMQLKHHQNHFHFFQLQEIFNFFSWSINRWNILQKHLDNSDYSLIPKNVLATRWSSRLDAVKALRYNLPIIYDSLLEIFETANDNIVKKNTAHTIVKKISNYKFILSVVCWYDILQRINIVSKFLQSHQINISQCINFIESNCIFKKISWKWFHWHWNKCQRYSSLNTCFFRVSTCVTILF